MTASTMPIEAVKVGSAVTVVTMEDLQQRGAQYAADALRYVPGVAVSRSGSFGGLTQIRVRGGDGNHVLVLIDGVEVADGGGEFDLSSLLAQGIERIEVLRGPQSGLYGSNAIAGVVNVITAGGDLAPAVDLTAEAGSFGSYLLGVEARGGSERANGGVSLFYREADGFNTSLSGREKDGYENLTLAGRGTFGVSETLSLSGAFRYSDRKSDTDGFDFSGGPNQGLSIDTENYSNNQDVQLSGGATWSAQDGAWVTRLSGSLFRAELAGGVEPFGSKTSREQLRLRTTRELGGGDSTKHAHFVTGFVDRKDEGYRNTVPFDPSQIPERSRGITGAGLEYRAELAERAFLSAAARHDDNEGFKNANTFRLTAAWLPGSGGGRLHASLGSGVTNPTFFEQFGFIPDSFVGNPDLRPEKATGWDVGFEQRFAAGRMSVDITYFDADLEDEIVSVFPTVVNDTGTSRRRGVELAMAGELGERLTVGATFTYTDAEDPDGTEEIRRPPRAGSLDLRYASPDGKTRAFAGVVYNGGMLDDDFRNFFESFAAEKTRLSAYTLVNVGASFLVGDRAELFGRIDNLFDEQYQEVIGYNTAGRAAYAGVRWSIRGGGR